MSCSHMNNHTYDPWMILYISNFFADVSSKYDVLKILRPANGNLNNCLVFI